MKNILVGITSGSGAGKSALARVFAAEGYPVLSADEIAREVVAPGSPALSEISLAFGPSSIQSDGSLHRGWVRSEIAAKPALRLKLEAITHPLIQARSLEKTEELFRAGAKVVFYEAPLLFEAKSDKKMDAVICVHANDGLRIRRVMARDGRSRAEVESLLASQMPQEDKMRLSTYCVANEGTEEDLREKGLAILKKLG